MTLWSIFYMLFGFAPIYQEPGMVPPLVLRPLHPVTATLWLLILTAEVYTNLTEISAAHH